MTHHSIYCCAIAVLFLTTGCATTTSSNTARTATEQLLISNAIDQSLNKVDFSALYGQKVFLETSYLDGVDKQYVIASLRHHLLYNGVSLASAADNADIILEPRSGGIGTDTTESYYGIPGIALPGGLINLPEIKLVTRMVQHGTAKIGLAAYAADSGHTVGGGGVSVSRAEHNNWHVLGVGPFMTGTVKQEITAATADDRHLPGIDLPRAIAFHSQTGSPPGTHELDLAKLPAPEIQQTSHRPE